MAPNNGGAAHGLLLFFLFGSHLSPSIYAYVYIYLWSDFGIHFTTIAKLWNCHERC